MIKLKTIRKGKIAITMVAILSLVTVLGCDFFCDIGLVSFSFADAHSNTHDGHEAHSSGHHPDRQHHHAAIEQSEHHPDESSQEDCCDDLTKRFYSSLSNQAPNGVFITPVQIFKIILTLQQPEGINRFNSSNLFISKFDHPPNGPPNINGRFVRVLINSFLI